MYKMGVYLTNILCLLICITTSSETSSDRFPSLQIHCAKYKFMAIRKEGHKYDLLHLAHIHFDCLCNNDKLWRHDCETVDSRGNHKTPCKKNAPFNLYDPNKCWICELGEFCWAEHERRTECASKKLGYAQHVFSLVNPLDALMRVRILYIHIERTSYTYCTGLEESSVFLNINFLRNQASFEFGNISAPKITKFWKIHMLWQ